MTGATQVHHHHHHHADDDDEEDRDEFPTTTTTTNEEPLPQGIHTPVMLDMTLITNAARPGPPSVATTQLASDVGSIVGGSKDAFLKSITFYKKKGKLDTEKNHNNNNNNAQTNHNNNNNNNGNNTTERSWALRLQPGTEKAKGVILRRNVTRPRLVVDAVAGLIAFSRIQQGDYLRSINGKKLGPSMMNPDRAMEHMESRLEKDGYLHLETSNKELGDDILVQATVIKPRPDMTLEEMGSTYIILMDLCCDDVL